jgi:hypothetical protein
VTIRDELRRIVDLLSDARAVELLDYAHWLERESETLTDEELSRVEQGEQQLGRGESVSWEELRRELNV